MMKRKRNGLNCGRGKRVQRQFIGMLLVLAGALVFHICVAAAHQKLLQQGIAEEVIRFHVLANSDEREDQEVKLYVRDAVFAWMESAYMGTGYTESGRMESGYTETGRMGTGYTESGCSMEAAYIESAYMPESDGMDSAAVISEIDCVDKQAVQQFLFDHMEDIRCVAEAELQKRGFFYGAQVKLDQCYFSERTYGDCTFPAGWYQALQICLGEAKGHNWWCVLYPKLSFSDCIHTVAEEGSKQELKELLTVEEYEKLVREPKQWQVCFRWLSWLNGYI